MKEASASAHSVDTLSRMDVDEIRKTVVIAMFSDSVLMDRLVLKGGNALSLVHKLGLRSSVDVDFSIADDFEDLADTERRIFKALEDRFDSAGFNVFDKRFRKKPEVLSARHGPQWGGYLVEFKIIEKSKSVALGGDVEAMRRNATVIGERQGKTFSIDISKFEFCEGKQEAELSHYTVYVYSPEMVAMEKLRAICQQMDEYPLRSHPRPRARDFYDIHTIITGKGLKFENAESLELLQNIFKAKDVPVGFLGKIRGTQEFHAADWDSVRSTTGGKLHPFSFYFDFVVTLSEDLLQALGVE
jgi:predicted nucleotidyltransferase component of viral defense system